jgi:transposase
VAVVVIGVDPHKSSHTAVAVGTDEQPLGQLRVRASAVQARRLLEWAQAWPERSWAVEGAGGLGHLLARQLLGAGERVLDVQPNLAARVRLLADEAVGKNDPNDARSVAITALRSRTVREVVPDDHRAVLKMWSRRQHDLGCGRTRTACRLHAALCELVPGGAGQGREITAAHAVRILAQVTASGAVQQARRDLAAGLLDDLCRADEQMRETKKRLAAEVQATGASLTGVFGVGAAIVIGEAGDITGSPARTPSLPVTAPPPSRSPPASGRSTGCPGAATAG